ncbi:NUDIX domain-containing protein [Pseudonocardia alni]|uniref:NUDIX domain-containing protein n=1 Tax=Pseudonocardia alni TaxID=33907 RepID=UPI0036A05349
MGPLLRGLEHARPRDISTDDLPADHVGPRQSAVLVLLGQGPEVVLQRRARRLRHHSGEISLPGSRADPGDADPAATVLRGPPRRPGWTRPVWTSSQCCRG